MKNIEMAQLYETLLCSPGMKETVKVDLRISRKSILLLSQKEEIAKSPKSQKIEVTESIKRNEKKQKKQGMQV